ncbi:MAG: hypothetical protein II038_08110 [Lachnospiraceae bacterium]|nr:hypothetical protein [Lachnospiraceae bacterium]
MRFSDVGFSNVGKPNIGFSNVGFFNIGFSNIGLPHTGSTFSETSAEAVTGACGEDDGSAAFSSFWGNS